MNNFTKEIAKPIFEIYSDYTHLQNKRQRILDELEAEENKFMKTIEDGMREFEKMIACLKCKEISGKDAFLLYQSYGFPLEMILEMAKEKKFKVNEKAFAEEFEKHQELSRTASAGVFKSGLADNSEATTKLHTAAHMLMAALRVVLKNPNIMQKGSNITPERLRMDFNFDRKLTEEEIKKVEDLVNSEAQKSCEVIRIECSPEQAKKEGAIGVFENKYGEKVSVYSIGKFSKEICAGPHVKNTCELGKFKIQKEESSSAGVRRIKAILE
jgi:alanyl-tRNA synthetase